MNWRFARICCGIIAWVIGLAALIYALNIGQVAPIPGAVMITEGRLCKTPDCSTGARQSLPYHSNSRFGAELQTRHFRFELELPARTDGIQALYLPKLSDNLDVAINRQIIHLNDNPRRIWNTPIFIRMPGPLVQTKALTIDITLYGRLADGLELQPFYFGPVQSLEPHFGLRYFGGPGLALFALGLVGILAVSLLVIWSFRRDEHEYLWLGLASAIALIFLAHYGYGYPIGGYKTSTLSWLLAVSLYVLLILKFIRGFLSFSVIWPERVHVSLLIAATGVTLLMPDDHTFFLSIWSNILITVPSACTVLVLLWSHRTMLASLDMRIFFGCLSISLALGIYEIYLHLSSVPTRMLHLFHWMPLVMSLACIWLILSRLIQSLKKYETLTASLNRTIRQKTAEIEANFQALEESRRRDTIAAERNRIMLDLHDGIGGQLVSTLAYMESRGTGDEKIRRALEDALCDLALMLDSMEERDSVVTLLGMLRTRLEGLLSENGLVFDWRVHGEPVLAEPGPSQNLHLVRIVQEAITNVIKHTDADTITIYVDENEIRVSDNGGGFDLDEQAMRKHPANGIANMKRRTNAIGARFSLTSDNTGTHVSLLLK